MTIDDKTRRIIEANQSERYRRLDALESIVEGRQYDGLRSWWDDSVPTWERKPCIRYSIVANAIRDNTALLVGESRFPRITTRPGEADLLEETRLDAEQSALIDAHVRALTRLTRFRSHVRAQLRHAQTVGTAVGLFGYRNRQPFCETVRAKWCEPAFDAHGTLISLEIRYNFVKSVRDQTGNPKPIVCAYRRIIDAQTDTSWEGLANESGAEPDWVEIPGKALTHGLGFVPVVWAPFRKECSTHDQIDGEPIHGAASADQLQALDIALSQRHRSALFLEPQWTEAGVDAGYNPTEPGRQASVPATLTGKPVSPNNPVIGNYTGPTRSQGTRKKGPGHVWQYNDPAVKVQLHQANADALRAISEHCSDLEAKLAEALAVVFLDPARFRFAASLSGRALKLLRQRQLDTADEIRDDFGQSYITPAMQMLLRIEAVCMARGLAVTVPGASQVEPILRGFLGVDEHWDGPELSLIWGPYADNDPTEDKLLVDSVVAARSVDPPLVPLHAAVQKLAPYFGLQDPQAALETIAQEGSERIARAESLAKRQAKADAEAFHAASAGLMSDEEDDDDASGAD